MRIRLEPAQPDDISYFWWLYQASYRNVIVEQFGAWDEGEQQLAFVRKWKAGGYQRIVVDDRIGGALWTRDLDEYHEVVEIQLAPALRKRGLGTALLRREITRAHAQRKPLRLSVLLKNPALHLYLRLGFEVIGRGPYQYHLALAPESVAAAPTLPAAMQDVKPDTGWNLV
ncbi:GNAT family N-acetyltransferase [Achromobacter sp. GG226]|uniref:GNAT family N-acetyltransferase n=1 Tax=Verticiella alkaliphila TaxID=2779529 RepID=UPI001C0B56FC|nr:GNAT family N-acetyltransferase [Verticiella sp. GG226]MBU4612718.1 GNAT family N-acetyltransferase [Verticiella sp. GG226]